MHSGVKQLGWHTECLFVENHGKINKGWKCFLNTFHCFLRQINSSIDKRVVPGKFRALPAGGALQQHRTASGLENNPACLTALTHTGMMSPRHYWYMNFREQIKVFHRGDFVFFSDGGNIPASAVFLLLSTLWAGLYWCGGSIICCHTSGYLQQSSWCTLNVQIINQSLNKYIITRICVFTFADRDLLFTGHKLDWI